MKKRTGRVPATICRCGPSIEGRDSRIEKERIRGTPLGAPAGTTVDPTGRAMSKISKAPELPKFSRADPVPREEGSFEQWYFQVKGSQSQHTEDAIRSGVVNSVRGEARDLVAYVGFDAPLESILSRLENRFQKIQVHRPAAT